MARARGNIGAATVKDFDSVIGARRGSAAAQAQRDTAEHQTRESARMDFFLVVEAGVTASGWHGSGETTWAAIELLAAWKRGEHSPNSPGYSAFVESLRDGCIEHGPEGLIVAVDYGDPAGYAGLTAPAIDGLTAYLRTKVPRPRRKYHRADAIAVVCHLLRGQRDPARYEQLSGVCEAISGFIASASESVEAGPMLCSWVPAFAERVRKGLVETSERQMLVDAVVGASENRALAELMLPLANVLRDKRHH